MNPRWKKIILLLLNNLVGSGVLHHLFSHCCESYSPMGLLHNLKHPYDKNVASQHDFRRKLE
jgi:hypothetical protein